MFVAVICADIQIGEKNSLKEKRKILRSVIDRLKNKFNVSVAEVGHQDKWQRAVIGFAIVSNDNAHANSSADKVINFLHSVPDIHVIKIDLEIIGF
jgi:uncharacterized protein YlxP (DUF503 family)